MSVIIDQLESKLNQSDRSMKEHMINVWRVDDNRLNIDPRYIILKDSNEEIKGSNYKVYYFRLG